jgi:hypothetical protein
MLGREPKGMTARAYRVWAPVLGLAWLVGCTSTHLVLHVRAPGHTDLADSIVRLIDDDQPICGGGLLFYGPTDPGGRIRIDTPACGAVQLVVTRRGHGTLVRALDTCEVNSLDVTLQSARVAVGESGSCEAVASDFVAAWIAADHDRARLVWQLPEAYEPFARTREGGKPWAVDVAPAAVDDRTCRVEVTEYYDTACDLGWELELSLRDERGWRVRALSQRRLPP